MHHADGFIRCRKDWWSGNWSDNWSVPCGGSLGNHSGNYHQWEENEDEVLCLHHNFTLLVIT